MKEIVFILFLLINKIYLEEIKNDENKKIPFCGVNYLNFNIQVSKTTKIRNINAKTRKLETVYTPIRIFIDMTNLDIQATEISNMTDKLPIIKSALNKSVNGISKLLEIKQFEDNVFSNLDSTLLNKHYIYKWDERLNNTEKISLDYDYVLIVRFQVENDNFPYGVLAGAMPILLEENTNRPIVGLMIITNYSTYFEKENAENYFSNIFIHELTHGFGFLRGAFEYFPGGIQNTLYNDTDSNGIERFYIKTEKVLSFAKKYFACEEIKGVEVENQGTGGSAGSISEFTLSLLEDSGWYKANYYTGGLMRFGKNKGCNFLKSHCIFYDYKYDNYYTYYNDEYFAYDMNGKPSCTTGRQSRAYNFLTYYPNIDPKFQNKNLIPYISYFTSYLAGFLYSSDYCPINYHYNNEYSKSYFVGHCKKGNGDYGSALSYLNKSTGQLEKNHTNSELPKELGEKYSENSFCLMSSLVPNGDTSIYGTIFHPMCFPSYCSSLSLTILVYDQYIVCPRKGGNVEVEGYKGILHCPDYNLICTGTVVCNDLFDCIEKKSEAKSNTFTYDYLSYSTQRYAFIETGQIFIGAELGEDGVCPKNCVQCLENKKCKVCLEKYNLIGVKENDDQPIICDNTIDIQKSYYLKDNVYYPCHENCETCTFGPISDVVMNCDECKKEFYYDNQTRNCYKNQDGSKKEKLSVILITVFVIFIFITASIGLFIYIKKRKLSRENMEKGY